jgi:rhamnosyl/mannosyltransferase
MINDVANKSSIIPFGIKDLNYKETTDIVLPFKKYLLFVGRLVEYKGLKYLLSSIKSTEYNLIIIGRGPLKEELEDKIREYKLQKQVTILTNINEQKDLNTIYKNAFAFVLPSISKNENFGMVQLEAMYFKLPIITTNIKSGVPSVGIPGESTILVSPKNSKELRDAFHKLYNEKGLASRMGMRGHELFKSKYTYENMINKHIENFQEIINEI